MKLPSEIPPRKDFLFFKASNISDFLKYFLLQLEVCSEILFLYHLIIGKLVRSTVEEDATFEKKIGAIGNVERFVYVMVGNQDTDVTMLKMPDNILNFLNRDRVNAGERLVKHDELRLYGKASCNLSSTTLTTRKLVAKVLAHFLQRELVDKAFKFLHLILTRLARHLKNRKDIIFYAHLTEHTRLLWQIANAITGMLINRHTRNLGIIDKHMSGIRHDKSGGHIE